jgi:ribosomal protein L28
MSTKCYFCEKGVSFGGHRKHKAGGRWEYRSPRTSKKLKPNLRTMSIVENGNKKVVDVCMKCYKKKKQ